MFYVLSKQEQGCKVVAAVWRWFNKCSDKCSAYCNLLEEEYMIAFEMLEALCALVSRVHSAINVPDSHAGFLGMPQALH